MTDNMNVYNENNQLVNIDVLLDFRIDKIGKEYVAYTVNDDGKSDLVNVFISENALLIIFFSLQ